MVVLLVIKIWAAVPHHDSKALSIAVGLDCKSNRSKPTPRMRFEQASHSHQSPRALPSHDKSLCIIPLGDPALLLPTALFDPSIIFVSCGSEYIKGERDSDCQKYKRQCSSENKNNSMSHCIASSLLASEIHFRSP